jgi:hypothetical protein
MGRIDVNRCAATPTLAGFFGPDTDCHALFHDYYAQFISIPHAGSCEQLGLTAEEYCAFSQAHDDMLVDLSTLGGYLALSPGTYPFDVETSSWHETVDRTLGEGDIADWSFDEPGIGKVPSIFSTTVTFTSSRVYPSAAPSTITSSCERPYDLSSAGGTLALTAFQFPECTYEVALPGQSTALVQTTSNAVRIGRIDVSDVTVTRQDGTNYVTVGTYVVEQNGATLAGPFATKTGIDVFPGDYRVVVTYTALDGTKTTSNQVTIQ